MFAPCLKEPRHKTMMIKPNASAAERESSYYKANEAFCAEFERYVLSKKGKVEGVFNAWSYDLLGEISDPKSWKLKYKKATYSSGNLFLPTKRQNLLVSAVWEREQADGSGGEFVIRRRRQLDRIRRLWNHSLSNPAGFENYTTVCKGRKSKLLEELEHILAPLLQSGEIYEVKFADRKLKIELRTDKHHFEIFEKLSVL